VAALSDSLPARPLSCGSQQHGSPMSAPARDLLARPIVSAFAWWLPQLGIAVALLAPMPVRVGVWTLALAWTGSMCLLNAARCGRTHCRYTGWFYLLLIVPTLAAGWIDAPTTAWITLAAVILIGGKVIWLATERTWGRFNN